MDQPTKTRRGPKSVVFTPEMDHVLLRDRSKLYATHLADKLGVTLHTMYRRLRELKQPIRHQHNGRTNYMREIAEAFIEAKTAERIALLRQEAAQAVAQLRADPSLTVAYSERLGIIIRKADLPTHNRRA